VKAIKLTQGKVALVDDADFEWLSQWKWYARKNIKKSTTWYAVRQVTVAAGKQTTVQMHRVITGVPPGAEIDHHDTNGLNNQRFNLRPATHSQNQHNQRKRLGCSSKFKGVSWDKNARKWKAYITIDGRIHHIGLFESEDDAAAAYDAAALEHFGEFALTNIT